MVKFGEDYAEKWYCMKNKKYNLIYDKETCEITVNGKLVTTWNDEAAFDYPEDLTWCRLISGIITDAFEAGLEFGRNE